MLRIPFSCVCVCVCAPSFSALCARDRGPCPYSEPVRRNIQQSMAPNALLSACVRHHPHAYTHIITYLPLLPRARLSMRSSVRFREMHPRRPARKQDTHVQSRTRHEWTDYSKRASAHLYWQLIWFKLLRTVAHRPRWASELHAE